MKFFKKLQRAIVIILYRNGKNVTHHFRGLKITETGSYSDRTKVYILTGWRKKVFVDFKDVSSMTIRYGSSLAPDGHTEFYYGYDTSQDEANNIIKNQIRSYGMIIND